MEVYWILRFKVMVVDGYIEEMVVKEVMVNVFGYMVVGLNL